MPVSWEIRDQILIVTVIKDWSGGGPAAAIMQAMTDPSFKPGTSILFDVRESQMNPLTEEIRSRTKWIASLRSNGVSGRCAVVVGPRLLQYGLARQAEGFLKNQDIELKIFKDFDVAVRWLASETITP
jgi:hypothetical protein